MSVCRPARCLLTRTTTTAALPKSSTTPSKHHFSTSTPRPARRRPHYPNIKASTLKLLNEAAETAHPKYQERELDLLSKKYTPSQLAAIRAAEQTIDARDLLTQSQRRTDPWRLPYDDDLAEVDPVTDHADKLSASDIKGRKDVRAANEIESNEAIAKLATAELAKLYPDGIPEGQLTFEQQNRLEEAMEAALTQAALDPRAVYTGDEDAVRALADHRHSVVLPDLPRIETRMAKATRRLANEEQEDPRQKRLLQYLGWDKQKLRDIRVKTLVTHGVTNQTRMGKIRSLYYLTIAGNGEGLLGVGEGKSVEPEEGRVESVIAAIRNMKPIPRYENRTIFGDLERKVGATKVELFSRPPGFGLRCQHLIFEMARAAGLQDLSARVPRSRNKMNVIKATWEALTNQKLPDEIARARGVKLVDVRKVYYGGSVH
ncbi:37S ribosomal protein-like protein S5 [Delitschia confertaspora ATCC 74209]|uniref:Small ribosomal subunit protein uS5m n=1 Tax=Delitschia confertaspora ATCC 74209 TaxID=1513339 RepID=A0A9P4MRW0_9PLEO|nr:37S ribosomal protein-like protein S5 [Delitschia confertaspora ATCC 74209]